MYSDDRLESFVYSEAFDDQCRTRARRRRADNNSDDTAAPYYRPGLLESDDDSGLVWVDPSEHGVPMLEANLYYFGIREHPYRGPKLIWRSSTDIFSPPSGPFNTVYERQLLPVNEHPKLTQDKELWPKIRQETVELLDNKNISFTSVDLVRFRWEEPSKDGINPPTTITSRATIWIGVLPDSTNGDDAFSSAQGIFGLLKRHDIDDLEVAFRESMIQSFAGPPLFAPADFLDPLKTVVDPLTTSLSLLIVGRHTHGKQGTLGVYFKDGDDYYGVTARHVLLPYDGGNFYRYDNSLPKRKVILMGSKGFDDLLKSIQVQIDTLNSTMLGLEKKISTLAAKVKDGDQRAAVPMAEYKRSLATAQEAISHLKAFFITLKKDWSSPSNRIIGHVVWSPPLIDLNARGGYRQDVCVIKLDKKKVLPNFRGNVIDLGTEMTPGEFENPLNPRRLDGLLEKGWENLKHWYPYDRIYQLKDILSITKMGETDREDIHGDPTCVVFKRGSATATTVGRLNGFESHTRCYEILGSWDCVQTAVLPYNGRSGPFSQVGDSGSAIVGAQNEFVAMLTSGAGDPSINYCAITYGTPMEWLWNEVIKVEFPNAVLFFDNKVPHGATGI